MANHVDGVTRSRINMLLQRASQHSVVIIEAGTGYGKTTALKDFVTHTLYRYIWLELTPLDQDVNHFWSSFLSALKLFNAELFADLSSYSFPKTFAGFNTFIRRFANSLYEGERVVFIVDNYDVVDNVSIDGFFKQIIDFDLENLSLIVMTSGKKRLGLSTKDRSETFTIGHEDLALTRVEIEETFEAEGYHLAADQLDDVEKLTNGWPLAIAKLSQIENVAMRPIPAQLTILDDIFEEALMSYPRDIQKLFIQLSILDSFTMDTVNLLGNYDPVVLLKALSSSMFVYYEKGLRQYSFWPLFRSFLRKRDTLSNDETRHKLLVQSAEAHIAIGEDLEAVECFVQCGEQERALDVIADHLERNPAVRVHIAIRLLEILNSIEMEKVEDAVLFKYAKARLLLNNIQFKPARELFLELVDVLSPGPLLSETYYYLGRIAFYETDEVFLDYFAKSYEACPEFQREFYLGNVNLFNVPNFETGIVDHVKDLMEKSTYFWEAHFGNSSMVDLFFAEAAYYTYNLEEARSYALKATQAAFQAKQHDVLCNANRLLAMIAMQNGDYEGFVSHLNFVVQYIDDLGLENLRDIRECARGISRFLHADLGADALEEPRSILMDESIAPLTAGGNRLVWVNHLLALGEYSAALTFLEDTEKEYATLKRNLLLLNVHVMKAEAQFRLGNQEASLVEFRKAYDMAYHTGLITAFIDRVDATIAILKSIPADSDFDPEWIKMITKHTSVFVKRVAKMFEPTIPPSAEPVINLSQREGEVLLDLAMGLTREEIAATRFIAVSTVKTVIANIYSKLGAVNRADAIRIAAQKSLL